MDTQLSLAGISLIGRSAAGIETCLQWPALDLLFDIGRAPPGSERQRNLLLSHGHIDHAAGLPYYVSLRSTLGMRPARVYCPAESQAALAAVLRAWTPLQTSSEDCELIGLYPGDGFSLKNDHRVEVFAVPHRISAVGYKVYRRRRHLRPELLGLPGREIAARAKAGEAVNRFEERLELAYTGDTSIEVFDAEPELFKARVLITECTFLGERIPPERATRLGHIHLDQLRARAERFENEAILLSHFSRRYPPAEIEDTVRAELPAALMERIQLLLPQPQPRRR